MQLKYARLVNFIPRLSNQDMVLVANQFGIVVSREGNYIRTPWGEVLPKSRDFLKGIIYTLITQNPEELKIAIENITGENLSSGSETLPGRHRDTDIVFSAKGRRNS